jgi:type I site-specific restriction endonuclease
MSYFADQYAAFRYSIEVGESPGFRLAQLGAIHAPAAHFAARTEPGIITMPTGSGKTTVLIASAFVLRAQRVLIITPSRLVREQIAEEMNTLGISKQTRALSPDTPPPRVFSTKTRISSSQAWPHTSMDSPSAQEATLDFDTSVLAVIYPVSVDPDGFRKTAPNH